MIYLDIYLYAQKFIYYIINIILFNFLYLFVIVIVSKIFFEKKIKFNLCVFVLFKKKRKKNIFNRLNFSGNK